MTATAEAIFWEAIEASAMRARTTSLDPRGRPGNVALARIKRSVEPILVTMPRDGAIIFGDLIGKLDVLRGTRALVFPSVLFGRCDIRTQ
jgi:hypothetical protein